MCLLPNSSGARVVGTTLGPFEAGGGTVGLLVRDHRRAAAGRGAAAEPGLPAVRGLRPGRADAGSLSPVQSPRTLRGHRVPGLLRRDCAAVWAGGADPRRPPGAGEDPRPGPRRTPP